MNIKKKRAALFLLLGLIVLVILLLWGCPFWIIIGVPCPGCGITRAWMLAVRGNLGEAFAMHPLYLLSLPMMGLIFMPRSWKLNKYKNTALTAIALVFIAVYAWRMVAMFPHTEPLVYNRNAVIYKIIEMGRGLS